MRFCGAGLGARVPARDRARLERLIRYMARPPLAGERLEMLPDGRLAYEFKSPWRDGTSRVICTPLEFIEKLVPLVPKPRVHLTRYSGVLGPAAKWRPAVVPLTTTPPPLPRLQIQLGAIAASASSNPETTVGNGAQEITTAEPAIRHARNYTWAELMRRVSEFDVLACECGGRLRILSAIHPPETTRRFLDCLGLPSRPPPIAPATPEPTLNSEWL